MWRVRAAQRRHQSALEELSCVGDRTPNGIENDSFRHRLALLSGDANLLHRADGRGDIQHDRRMALGGEAVCEGVCAEDRRPTPRRSDQRNEVRASEADQAGLRRQPGVGPGDHELPVPDRGDRHPLTLPGALDTPPHCSGRRARPTAAVSVEQHRTVRLVQHADARARVQLAVPVESGQSFERRNPVVRVAAKLRVHQEPTQSLGVVRRELEALEGIGQAAPQVIDLHQSRAFTPVLRHPISRHFRTPRPRAKRRTIRRSVRKPERPPLGGSW